MRGFQPRWVLSPSSYYIISRLPLKATLLKAVVHTVAKISIPTPCCTFSKEAFTCYFNNIGTTNNLPTARRTGRPQMIVPHLLAFHTDPSHLLKTLTYSTLITTLFRFPAWLVLPYLHHHPLQQVSFSFLSLFFPRPLTVEITQSWVIKLHVFSPSRWF